MRNSAEQIADQAAYWVARLDREGDNIILRAEIDAWAVEDARHVGALLRAEAAWQMLDRAAVLGGALGARAVQDADVGAGHLHSNFDGRLKARSSRWAVWGGLAASAAAAALMLSIAPLPWQQKPVEIETVLGEIRQVPLEDGSLAAVNTDSKLLVALKPEARDVVLERGEAWFQVAKDTERPFVVVAGDIRVRAVGTAFAVHKRADGVDVRVTEGVVEIWRDGEEALKRRVSAGDQLNIGQKGMAKAVPSDEPIDRALSWRDGQLIFDGDTLAEAADKFNRYNDVKIVVQGDEIAKSKMVGRFRTREVKSFARAASALLDANIDEKNNIIIISKM